MMRRLVPFRVALLGMFMRALAVVILIELRGCANACHA